MIACAGNHIAEFLTGTPIPLPWFVKTHGRYSCVPFTRTTLGCVRFNGVRLARARFAHAHLARVPLTYVTFAPVPLAVSRWCDSC